MNSVLVKKQTIDFKKIVSGKEYGYKNIKIEITASIRFDDNCGNGHNTFSITGDIRKAGTTSDYHYISGGCIHSDIEKHFPELSHLIKWHLVSSDGPLHYIANTTYHALQHEPNKAHVYLDDKENGFKSCVKYTDIKEAQTICENPIYTLKVDQDTAKVANIKAARNCAIWPDATLAELSNKELLLDRLPALMVDFKRDIEAMGLIF